MSIATSRTFKTSEGEAVTLPPEIAYGEGVELMLERSGDVTTLRPTASRRRGPSGRELVEALRSLPRPSQVEVRDVQPLPEREGL